MLGGNHGFASPWPLTVHFPWPLTGGRQNSAIVSAPAPRLGVGLALRWRRAARGEEKLTEPGRFSMRKPYGERMVIIHPLDRQGNTVAASAHKVVREGRRQVRPHENAPVPTRAIPAFARVQRTLMLFAYQRCDPRVGGHETIGRWVRASEYLASSHRCFFPPSGCPSRAPTGAHSGPATPKFGRRPPSPPDVITLVCAPWKNPGPRCPAPFWTPHSRGPAFKGASAQGHRPVWNDTRKRTVPKKAARTGASVCTTQRGPRGPRRRLRWRPPRRRAAGASLSVCRPCHPPRTGR